MTIGFKVPDFNPAPDQPCFCDSGEMFENCCGSKSPRRRPPAGVNVARAFLPHITCEEWVNYLETRPRKRTQVMDMKLSSPGAPVFVEDPARVCDDVDAGDLRSHINKAVLYAYSKAAQAVGQQIEWFESPRVLRYKAGGYYIRHADSCQVGEDEKTWYKVQDRDLSLLMYINDDYTGGGLSFTKFNCHFRPGIGDLLIFPSDNRYEHRAEVVESGFRYAIVSWAACRGERRVLPRPPPEAIPVRQVRK
jgi:hypothetical protein